MSITSEEEKELQSFITSFIKNHLEGDIDKLKDFSFETLKGDEDYGCSRSFNCQKYNFDCLRCLNCEEECNFQCDDTKIVKYIYCAVWGDVLPGLTFDKIGSGEGFSDDTYRGDTMNTFATILSKPLEK